jgi:hypothetical protein
MSKKGGSGAAEGMIELIFFLCIVAAVIGWVIG